MHAHVSTESADCDGRYSRSYVRKADEAGLDDYDFRVDTIGHALVYVERGSTVTFTDYGFTVTYPTDEGYYYEEVTWCDDDDADEKSTYRDHSAEAAGY